MPSRNVSFESPILSSSPESCAVPDEHCLATGGDDVIDFFPLLKDNLALQDTDPLVIVQGQKGFFGALLGSRGCRGCKRNVNRKSERQIAKLKAVRKNTTASKVSCATYWTLAMEIRSFLEATLPASSSMESPGASTTLWDVPTMLIAFAILANESWEVLKSNSTCFQVTARRLRLLA